MILRIFLCFIYFFFFTWVFYGLQNFAANLFLASFIHYWSNSAWIQIVIGFYLILIRSRPIPARLLCCCCFCCCCCGALCANLHKRFKCISWIQLGCLARSRRRPIEQITEDFGSSAWWAFLAGTFNCICICICSYICICICIARGLEVKRAFTSLMQCSSFAAGLERETD